MPCFDETQQRHILMHSVKVVEGENDGGLKS